MKQSALKKIQWLEWKECLMDSHIKPILRKFKQLKGQFVITESHEVERLIAIGDDGDDYYWITFNGRILTWNTCVGGLVPLKGYLRKKDYNKFVSSAKLNHWDQISPDIEQVKIELTTLKNKHKFVTEVCWDLN